jgi:hypothetical protein
VLGVRSLYHQLRRGFREPEGFDVRYWTIGEMKRALARRFRAPEVSVHCYFGLGLEPSDLVFVRPVGRLMIRLSEALRNTSHFLPPLKRIADSLYVSAVKSTESG